MITAPSIVAHLMRLSQVTILGYHTIQPKTPSTQVEEVFMALVCQKTQEAPGYSHHGQKSFRNK